LGSAAFSGSAMVQSDRRQSPTAPNVVGSSRPQLEKGSVVVKQAKDATEAPIAKFSTTRRDGTWRGRRCSDRALGLITSPRIGSAARPHVLGIRRRRTPLWGPRTARLDTMYAPGPQKQQQSCACPRASTSPLFTSRPRKTQARSKGAQPKNTPKSRLEPKLSGMRMQSLRPPRTRHHRYPKSASTTPAGW
jgi:hypothetical protein